MKAVGERTLMELIRFEQRKKRVGNLQRLECLGNDSLLNVLEHLPAETPTASEEMARREALAAFRVCVAGLEADQRRAIQLQVMLHEQSWLVARPFQGGPDHIVPRPPRLLRPYELRFCFSSVNDLGALGVLGGEAIARTAQSADAGPPIGGRNRARQPGRAG